MPDLPRRADDAVPPIGDSALDALLAVGQPPQPAAPALRPVAEVLAALRAGPGGGELAGKARALAEFREAASRSGRPHRVSARRGRLPRLRLGVKLTAAAAGAALAVGGTAAYAGVLPAPLQEMAHVALAAPAATMSSAPAPHRSLGARAGAAARQPADDGAVPPRPAARQPGRPARPAGGAGRPVGGPARPAEGPARPAREAARPSWLAARSARGPARPPRGAAPPAGRCRASWPEPACPPGRPARSSHRRAGRSPLRQADRPSPGEACCGSHSPAQRHSRFRPPALTGQADGRRAAGRVPFPGGPGPRPRGRAFAAESAAEVNGPGWLS